MSIVCGDRGVVLRVPTTRTATGGRSVVLRHLVAAVNQLLRLQPLVAGGRVLQPQL